MFPFSSLLVSALLATSVMSASDLEARRGRFKKTQSFNKVYNATNLKALIDSDHQRAQGILSVNLADGGATAESSFVANTNGLVGSAHATNQAIYYTTAVQVGKPSTNYQLIIDTGSANTWVGSKTKYKATSTSTNTGAKMQINYQSSKMTGTLYYDQVGVSSSVLVGGQAIGVATSQSGFDGVDGVLGLDPKALTKGTTSQGTNVTYPTFTDTLFTKGVTSADVFSLSFAPTNSVGSINGQITFGGVDSTQYNSALTYAALTTKYPASAYWGVNLGGVGYGSTKLFTETSVPAIVESGLTLVYLATDAFKKYQSATGAVLDTNVNMLKITTAQLSILKPLDFTINGVKFSLSANAQLWPRSLNTAISGAAYNIYLVIADLGTDSGSGLDVVLGQAWMERFFTTFDATNKRVGFATTKYTNSTIN